MSSTEFHEIETFRYIKAARRLLKPLTNRLIEIVQTPGIADDLKNEAVLSLGKIGDVSALDTLSNALDGRPDAIEPITALGYMRDSTPVPRLLELLDMPEHPFKEEIVRVIGLIGEPMAAKKLMELLHDQDRMIRYEAAWALYRIGGRDVAQSLSTLLSDSDEWIVINVLEILSQLKETDVIPALVGQFEIARDPRLKAIMISSLAMFAEPQLLPIFEKGLESFDPRIQANSVEALAMLKIPAPEMNRKLKKFFGHPNNRVRANVCIALAKIDPTKVAEELALMADSPDIPTRRSAAYVLSRIQIPDRNKLIDRLLADSSYSVRKMALKATLALETEVSQTRILPLLRDSSQWVRREAVECAIKIPQFPPDPILEAFKAESSPAVWESMLSFFTKRNLNSAVPIIMQKIKSEPEEGLPQLIAALGQLDAQNALIEAKNILDMHKPENLRAFTLALMMHGKLDILQDLEATLKEIKGRDEEIRTTIVIAGEVGEFLRNPDTYSPPLREALEIEVRKDMEGVVTFESVQEKTAPALDSNYLEEAKICFESGKIDEAQNRYEKFLEAFPRHPEALYKLACIYFKKSLFDKAVTKLELLLAQKPSHSAGALLLGQIYFKKKQWKELLELYEPLIQQMDNVDKREAGQIYGALGLANFHLKKYKKALETLKKALDINPRDLSSSYHLALSYYAMHDHKTARELLTKLKKALPPDSRVFRNVEELLQKLEDEN